MIKTRRYRVVIPEARTKAQAVRAENQIRRMEAAQKKKAAKGGDNSAE